VIVCHCNVITKSEIVDTVRDLLRPDPWQLITAGQVYHAMEKRGRCCGCFPGVIDIIISTTEAVHAEMESHSATVIDLVARIRAEHQRFESIRQLKSRAA